MSLIRKVILIDEETNTQLRMFAAVNNTSQSKIMVKAFKFYIQHPEEVGKESK